MAVPKRSSLKCSLVLPFVILIALLTGTLGVLWYWTGTKTVSTLSQQLINEMAERISLAVEHHISQSAAVLEAAFAQGQAEPEDIRDNLKALQARL